MRLYYLFLKSALLESLLPPEDMFFITHVACTCYRGDMYAYALEVQGELVEWTLCQDSKELFISIILSDDDDSDLMCVVGDRDVFELCKEQARTYYLMSLDKNMQ